MTWRTKNCYRRYKLAAWNGNHRREGFYRKRWLKQLSTAIRRGMGSDLPDPQLREIYLIMIDNLLSSKDDLGAGTLLHQRFQFSSSIDGKPVFYRDLSSMMRRGLHVQEVRDALLEETSVLLDHGFVDLLTARNQIAVDNGYNDYWTWKNRFYGNELPEILISLDHVLQKKGGSLKERDENARSLSDKAAGDSSKITPGDVLFFFCNAFFPPGTVPRIQLRMRTGDDCPPGPPGCSPLAYRSARGHCIGLNLPFVHNGGVDSNDLMVLFHELTHMFHFAAAGFPGIYSFAPELARDNLIYEIDALALQYLLYSRWVNRWVPVKIQTLKDQVYLAESERQMYKLSPMNRDAVLSKKKKRIVDHYPQGDFIRTPLGASHLIDSSLAGTYWMYPLAQTTGYAKIIQNPETNVIPYIVNWKQGNERSHILHLMPELSSLSADFLKDELPVGGFPEYMKYNHTITELSELGYGDFFQGI